MLGFLRNITADFILVAGLIVCVILAVIFGALDLLFSQPWITPLIWIALIFFSVNLVRRSENRKGRKMHIDTTYRKKFK
jgi:membrane protein implicated in regulation of membrane protease activity